MPTDVAPPGAADEPPLSQELDTSIDPEYWSLPAEERDAFRREADQLERLIDAAHRGERFDGAVAQWVLDHTEWEPEETHLNTNAEFPGLDGD